MNVRWNQDIFIMNRYIIDMFCRYTNVLNEKIHVEVKRDVFLQMTFGQRVRQSSDIFLCNRKKNSSIFELIISKISRNQFEMNVEVKNGSQQAISQVIE